MNRQGKTHHMPSIFPPLSWDTRNLNHQIFQFQQTWESYGLTMMIRSILLPLMTPVQKQLIRALYTPGGFFIHQFSTPGIYEYYDDQNPSAKGRINVGGEFESGQYMNMLVGGDALPFEAGKVGRTTFSFVPNDNVTTIPPSLSITYNVAIADSNGTELYSGQFDDSDGILDLELIPSSRSLSSSSNQTTTTAASNQTASSSSSSSNQTTASNFVTWGPDLTDQEGVASDGVYHVQGPVLTENEDYTITVSISSIDDTIQQPATI